MRKNVVTVISLSCFMSACGPTLFVDPNRETCLSYGFLPGTESFANCMLEQEKMDRKDSRAFLKPSKSSSTSPNYSYAKSKVKSNSYSHASVNSVVQNNNISYKSSPVYDKGFYHAPHGTSNDDHSKFAPTAASSPPKQELSFSRSNESLKQNASLGRNALVRQQEQAREEERRQQRLAEQKMEEARRYSIEAAQRREQEERLQNQQSAMRLAEMRRQQEMAAQQLEYKRHEAAHQAKMQQHQQMMAQQVQAEVPPAPPPPVVMHRTPSDTEGMSFNDELQAKLRKRRQQIGE